MKHIRRFFENTQGKEFTITGKLEILDGVTKLRGKDNSPEARNIDGTTIKSGNLKVDSLTQRGWKNGDGVTITGTTENGAEPKSDNPILINDINHDKDSLPSVSGVKYCSQCGKTNEGVTEPYKKFCTSCGAKKILAQGYLDHKLVQTIGFYPPNK